MVRSPSTFADPGAVLAGVPDDVEAVAVRDGARTIVAAAPDDRLVAVGRDALAALDRPRAGWWAGWLSFDLGRAVERVIPRAVDDLRLPDVALGRFDARLVLEPPSPEQPEGRATVVGDGRGRELLEAALASAGHRPWSMHALGPWTSTLERPEYEAGVRAVVELLRAGECYQVNLTRRLTARGEGDPVALFNSLRRHNPAPHEAFVRLAGTTVVSASPERFLRRDGDQVETRPIKGTGRDPERLAASAKDRAENVMIVDLARNDLGRVCEYGSLDVPALCAVEAHPGLHHLVSTVTGRLRGGTTTGALLRATFPPASVTGAPKPRVLQAIEDLEPVRRGIYCGSVGWVDEDASRLDFNVAIRTFVAASGHTHLGVGGGIVVDSEPAAEWEETELKAARLLEAAGLGLLEQVGA